MAILIVDSNCLSPSSGASTIANLFYSSFSKQRKAWSRMHSSFWNLLCRCFDFFSLQNKTSLLSSFIHTACNCCAVLIYKAN